MAAVRSGSACPNARRTERLPARFTLDGIGALQGRNVLDCRGAAADRQPVGLLDAAAATWRNGTSAGSAAGAAARLLSSPRDASLQRGSSAARRHAWLARRRLPLREPSACSHSAGAVLTKQGTGPRAKPAGSPDVLGATGVGIGSPWWSTRIARTALHPLTFVSRWFEFAFAVSATRNACAHLSNRMQNGEMMCCRQEKGELRLYGRP
jgi:hypothetical protein